ncbi:MAG: condensation domain-containing protein [Acidobacteria bacterium]|nr:condensation domain-containing protein [Acidobacteriota bacterium]
MHKFESEAGSIFSPSCIPPPNEKGDIIRDTSSFKEKGKIIQFNQGLDIPLDLRVIDLRSENDADVLEKKVNEIQSGINLSAGPLMKLGLFHMNDGDRLLVVIHHLVVDGISWRILLEDIDILFGQYNRGEEMILPAKTDSFNIWAEKLLGYANSDTFLKKSSYWAKLETNIITGIKKDFETEDNCVKDTQRISFTLGEEETNLLLSKVNNAFKTEINDILLTALGLGVKKAFGQDRVLIAMEGHGREEIIENIDISRTVGWFTSLYPVLLDVSYADDPGRQVKEIKETLRKIPEKGTGYGILKYLTGEEHKKEMDFKLKPQISFNYLGQIDTDVQQISFLKIAGESTGNMQSLTNQRKFEVEINGITSNKMLSMTLSYNEKHFKTVTMETFMNHFQSELRHMITFCCAKENMEFTPSDFTYKGLSIENVDRLMELYPGMEDIYTLTPLQEGILFHSLYDDSSYSYFVQVSYRLQGDLDIYLVEKSLNELFKRHDILRTAFFYKNLEQHVQVVLKDRTVGFYYEDISITRDKKEKEALIESFKTKDKDRMFDLSKDALMRVSILRVDKSEYEFTWSFHHILMDGWCSGILITEFLEIYTGYLENRPYRLPSIKQFRSYIQWLDKQDKEASAAYWKNYLDDFEQQTPLLKKTTIKKGYRSETVSFVINKEETTRLNELSAAHHVTLNTLIQATWGILLGKYNGKNDVVFGAVVSGRPFELEGVESIVGLFINAIPIRVRFEGKMKFFQLLKKIQTGAIEAEKHHHCPLVDIQSGSLLKRNLFDHIMAFENYPLTERIEGYGSEGKASNKPHFELTNVDIFEQSNYDFNVAVSVSETININFLYNGHAYERNLIERIGSHLSLIMDQVIGNYQIEIEEIELLSSQEKQNILEDFKNEYVEYPKDKNISEEENEEYSGDFGFN